MKTLQVEQITVKELMAEFEKLLDRRDIDGWLTKAELMQKYRIKDHRTVNTRVEKGSILKKTVAGNAYYKAI